MKLKFFIGLIILPEFAIANTMFDGQHSIAFDTLLDGVVSQPIQNSLSFSGTGEHFIADSNSQILSGYAASNDSIIKFNLSNKDGSDISFYAGNLGTNGIYKGTWYSANGASGDWQIDSLIEDNFQNCKQILDSGNSLGDGQYNISIDGGSKITVYCDMTTDEGGWTLVGSYPKTAAGGILRISEYPSIPETSPNNPNALWLYKWNLAHFSDVREQISCSSNSCIDGKSVYGAGFSELELDNVRFSWGYSDRIDHMPQFADVPSCRKSYTDNLTWQGCAPSNYSSNTSTVVGWQVDLFGTTSCWVARGDYNPSALGSSLCVNGSSTVADPNGTKWALLWMR